MEVSLKKITEVETEYRWFNESLYPIDKLVITEASANLVAIQTSLPAKQNGEE